LLFVKISKALQTYTKIIFEKKIYYGLIRFVPNFLFK